MRSNPTNASDLFRRIEDLEMRAEVEVRTEKQNVYLIAKWLREKGHEDLASGIEALEWYPQEWRNPDGSPRK